MNAPSLCVTFVTGHSRTNVEPDWAALVRARTTLVIYMGVSRGGTDAATPPAAIEQGGAAGERQVLAPSGGPADAVRAEGLGAAVPIAVGEVVSLAHGAQFAKAAGVQQSGLEARPMAVARHAKDRAISIARFQMSEPRPTRWQPHSR